jgi:nucleoid-associated protein YgaU
MGRDKVLGLSLAILLIGFAGAFCFRNEQFVESGLKLARAKILDEAIAQRPGPKPYAPDPKAERDKSSSPSVTLQGIESIEPFSDLQSGQSADRDKAAVAKEKKKTVADGASESNDIKPAAETKTPAIGNLTVAAITRPAPDDLDRPASEINTEKPATVAATPAADGAATVPASSNLLTSAEPPASEPSSDESRTPLTEIIIRPKSPQNEHTDVPVQHNVAWQPTAGQHDRGPLADNSPRYDSTRDDSTRDSSTRDNSTGDDPSRENPPRDNPNRDNPNRENATRDNSSHDSPTADSPSNDADGSSNPLVHRVRRGDTLTKLALHYLGDSSRYREIYNANRDQLRSPDDRLKIGMTLRIPRNTAKPDRATGPVARRKSRSNRSSPVAAGTSRTRKPPIRNVSRMRETPPTATSNQPPATPSDDENMNSEPLPPNRFVPVRKAPFVPANPEKQDSAAPAPDMSHYRFFPRAEPVRIAGDRDDVIVR